MSDAACKLFCDAHTHHGLDPHGPAPPAIAVNLTLAKDRLRQCVVGLQEDWETTKLVMAHFMPWLRFEDQVQQQPCF
jgi:hypothetical protein